MAPGSNSSLIGIEKAFKVGVECALRGWYREAVTAFRRAVDIHPGFAEAHWGMGAALGEMDRHEEAASSFVQAIELDPELVEAHYNLGIAMNRLGRAREANEAFHKAISLRPEPGGDTASTNSASIPLDLIMMSDELEIDGMVACRCLAGKRIYNRSVVQGGHWPRRGTITDLNI